MKTIRGSQLPADQQQAALAMFVHRFTKDHTPEWAKRDRLAVGGINGGQYPVQFASDTDWLANTDFFVTKGDQLSRRENHCESHPTWPDNPELRGKS